MEKCYKCSPCTIDYEYKVAGNENTEVKIPQIALKSSTWVNVKIV